MSSIVVVKPAIPRKIPFTPLAHSAFPLPLAASAHVAKLQPS